MQVAPAGLFSREVCLPSLPFFKLFIDSFDALTPSGHFAGRAGAPPFLLLQKRRQKSRLKGALRPLENPLACGRARVPSAQPREGRAELLAASAAGASALDFWVPGACAPGLRAKSEKASCSCFSCAQRSSAWDKLKVKRKRKSQTSACRSCANAHGTA